MGSKSRKLTSNTRVPVYNVPAALDQLIGRNRDLRTLDRMILRDGARLVSLVGPPGVGKTRLAIEAVARVAPRFETGAHMVDLSPITDPELAFPTIARALGRESEQIPVIDWLKRSVQYQPLLLLLDNAEQLLPHFASELATLLAECPLLTVMVTSREELHVRGERILQVLPLGLPESLASTDHSSASRSPAVKLFAERAREVNPAFALTPSNTPTVIEICRRLDGLPLAIELAAARTSLFSPDELLARLDYPLEVLSDGARDLPPRHRTLQIAIEWSYNLLDPTEQALMRRLAVFSGGCTMEAIAAVCAPEGNLVEILASLVRKNLLQVDPTGDADPGSSRGGQTRFTLLVTIREYALEQLARDPHEHAETHERHAACYLDTAERAVSAIVRASPDQAQIAAMDELEREYDNLRSALRWAVSDSPNAELAARLTRALGWFWYSRGHLNEGWNWAEKSLARDMELRPYLRAGIRLVLTAMALRRGDFSLALTYADEGVAILRRTTERVDLCHLLGLAGQAALGMGDHDRAEELLTESHLIAREMQHAWHEGGSLWALSQAALAQGDLGRANDLATDALSIWSEIGDTQGIVLVMDVLAAAARQAGDLDRSRQLDEESLSLRRTLGDRPGIGASLRGLADVARQRRQDSRARSLYAESIEIALDVGDLPGIAACLEGLAAITMRHQRPEWAATLLGAAEQARFRMDMAQSPASSQVAEYIATVQASLTPEEFDRAWTAGRERPLDETFGRARTHLIPHATEPPARQRAPTSMPAQLSRRERQIAALIARGYDNARIADELTLSKRTIETHVSNILRKLNLDSRVQIVLWATDHALTGDSTA